MASGAITFLDITDEPLSGTLDFRVNITCDTGSIDDVILTIDDDTSTSRTLGHLGNDTWGLTLETFDLANSNHTFKITATSGDSAESRTLNHSVLNPVRILFPELPERASGFLLFEALILDDRLDTTNVWYSVDAGEGLIFPNEAHNRFQVIVDVDGLPDGPHDLSVKAINVDNVVTMRGIQVLVDNNATDIQILPPAEDDSLGRNGTFQLRLLAGGSQVDADSVWYGVDNELWGRVPYRQGHLHSLYVPTSNLSKGAHQLFVQVRGGDGTVHASDEMELLAPGPDEDEFPWMVFGASLVLVVIATLLVFSLVIRKKVVTPEDAFLIYYANGVLMKHLNRVAGTGEATTTTSAAQAGDEAGEGPDKELVTSMLMAIQDFVETSFASGDVVDTSHLRQIAFGDSTILIEKGENVVLALVVPARPKELALATYEDHMHEVIDKVETGFEPLLKRWDGDRSALKGLEDILGSSFQIGTGFSRIQG